MSATDERNERVRKILDSLYARAVDAGVEIDESAYKDSLENFSLPQLGDSEKFSLLSLSGCVSTVHLKHQPVYTTAIQELFMKALLRNS